MWPSTWCKGWSYEILFVCGCQAMDVVCGGFILLSVHVSSVFYFFFLWHGVLKFFWSYVNVNFKTGGWNFIMWFPVNIEPVRQSRGWGTKFRKLSYFAKQMNKINKWMNKNFHPLIYENLYLRAMRFTANKKLFYLRARRDMRVPQRTMSRDHSSCEAAGFWGGKGRGGET